MPRNDRPILRPQADYGKFALAFGVLLVLFFGYDYFSKRDLAKDGVTAAATITNCKKCHYSFCYDYMFVVGLDTCGGTVSSSVRLSYDGNEGCTGRLFQVTYDPENCSNSMLDLAHEIFRDSTNIKPSSVS